MTDKDRIELLRNSLKAIKRSALDGSMGPGEVWIDQTERLDEFCERIIRRTDDVQAVPSALADD